MTNTARIKVSKSNPRIKAILAATFPAFAGRRITVVITDGSYTYTDYVGDGTLGRALRTDGSVGVLPNSVYGRGLNEVWCPTTGTMLVLHHRRIEQCIEIVVHAPEWFALVDNHEKGVIVDALLGGSKTERAVACAMLADRTPAMSWGSLDRGHEVVTVRDVLLTVLEEAAKTARKSEAKAEYV